MLRAKPARASSFFTSISTRLAPRLTSSGAKRKRNQCAEKTQRSLYRHTPSELYGNSQRALVADFSFSARQDPAIKAHFDLVFNAEKRKAQRQNGRAHLAVVPGTLHIVGHPYIKRDRLTLHELFRHLAFRRRSLFPR